MTLTLTNEDLKEHVARFLGYGDSEASWDVQQARDLTRIVAEAKRKFYNPDVLPGEDVKHTWSFLSPVLPFMFTSNIYEYDLPAGFAMLNGPIQYAPGADSLYPSLSNVGWEKVLWNLQQNESSGRPLICGLKVMGVDTNMPTLWKLIVHPVPDADYQVMLPCKLDPLEMGGDDNLPIGDHSHVDTLLEGCLAAAERFNLEPGVHTDEYYRRLQSSIYHDRQLIAPETLGACLDRSDNPEVYSDHWRRTYSAGIVTYNGVTPG